MTETHVREWTLGAELGRGGMGIVYEARHQLLPGAFAMKVIRPELAQDPSLRQRMLQEASLLSTLRHAHIVQAQAPFEEGGILYLPLERLEGEPLDIRLRRESGPIALAECVAVGLQTAAAVAFAHSRGVLHRDLKPGNLFLTQKAGHPVWVKVLDFGLAKSSAEQSMTAAGSAVGTPAYMSPEVLKGHPATPAADVYAIGLILYRMLTGRPAFEVPDAHSTPWAAVGAVFQAHQAGIPPVGRFAPVPAPLVTLVAECIAENPLARPTDASVLLRRLQEATGGQATGGQATGARLGPVVITSSPLSNADVTTGKPREDMMASTVVPVASFRPTASDPLTAAGSAAVSTPRGASPTVSAAAPVGTGTGIAATISGLPKSTRLAIAGAAVVLIGVLAFALWPKKNAPDNKKVTTAAAEPLPAGMVPVAAGEFVMGYAEGDEHEKPVRKVFVSAYAIDRTEVTVEDYWACVNAKACTLPAPSDWVQTDTPKHPIRNINWDQASTYCNFVGKRLPTEAEWEKAARGTDGRIYPWGNDFTPGLVGVSSEEGALEMPGDVGQYPGGQSPYGAFDMSGSVTEWVSDWYGPYTPDDFNDPKGPVSGTERALRGSNYQYDVNTQRATIRGWAPPATTSLYFGVRCAKSM
ncbi:MAG: SUMF1/EgtB/PvdO family nonheme iron enzyme [Myxococcales bacterium]|nr:SUMF1/EgtB/PvdO family nonheme iron enzyme [Myxococcales bacterium]